MKRGGVRRRLPENVVVRTLKQKDNSSAVAVSRSTSGEESLLKQVLLMALWGMVALIVPRATVYGSLAPFGVGAAAAVSGPGSVVVYLATGMGYLLPEGAASPLRYLAAVAAVAGIRWSLNGLKRVTKSALFAPVAAFLATGMTRHRHDLDGKTDLPRLSDGGGGESARGRLRVFRIDHLPHHSPGTA